MLKTKKAIFEWWKKRGSHPTARKEFKKLISPSIKIKLNISITQRYGTFALLTLMKDTWKYPLYLTFDYLGNCIRIEGF